MDQTAELITSKLMGMSAPEEDVAQISDNALSLVQNRTGQAKVNRVVKREARQISSRGAFSASAIQDRDALVDSYLREARKIAPLKPGDDFAIAFRIETAHTQ